MKGLSDPDRPVTSRWTLPIGRAVVASGIVLRLAQLMNGRPLWLDEASLALNILTRSLADYFSPLNYEQISPLGFLLGEWLVTRLAGPGELALRLIPFAASVVALIAFARLARRLLDPPGALVAMALVALSPLLLRYSAEVRSYELDALTAILLVLATLDLAETSSARNAWRWALAAAFAALLSTPAPFTVAGSALALLIVPRIRRDPRALLRLALLCAPAAILYALQMLTVYDSPRTTAFMRESWVNSFLEPDFIPATTGLARAARDLWLTMLFGSDRGRYLPHGTLTVVLVLSVAGTVSLARRDRFRIALLLAPFGLAACAALAQRWPLTPRLLLFVAPAVFIIVAAGVSAVARLAPARARAPVLAALAIALIVATGIRTSAEMSHPSPSIEPMSRAIAEVASGHGANATVYVSSYFVPGCVYYSAWHSRRTHVAGDSTERVCAIPGARTLHGRGPLRPPGGTPLEADGHPPIAASWIASESARIFGAPTGELWLIVLPGSVVSKVLRRAVEAAGAVPVGEQRMSDIAIYRYRVPPHPRLEPTEPR